MAAWLLRATSNTSSISRARLLARRLHAVVGPRLVHLRLRLLPSSPVAGSTPVVGECNDLGFLRLECSRRYKTICKETSVPESGAGHFSRSRSALDGYKEARALVRLRAEAIT